MKEEQIVAAAKTIDTPYGKIGLIHTRDDGVEVPTVMAKQFADAINAMASSESAFDRIDACRVHEFNEATPLDRLRLFCAEALNGPDWSYCHPLFAALEEQIEALSTAAQK